MEGGGWWAWGFADSAPVTHHTPPTTRILSRFETKTPSAGNHGRRFLIDRLDHGPARSG